MWWRESDDG